MREEQDGLDRLRGLVRALPLKPGGNRTEIPYLTAFCWT